MRKRIAAVLLAERVLKRVDGTLPPTPPYEQGDVQLALCVMAHFAPDLLKHYPMFKDAHPMAHTCHWPGCKVEVVPAMWGCKPHWFKLPRPLRQKVWRAYVPGQEITKTPSAEYLAVANEVQAWIGSNFRSSPDEQFPPKRMRPDGSRF